MSINCPPNQEAMGEPTVRRRLEPDESVSVAVVEAVATASGRSPVPDGSGADPLPPLYDAIEPDAINALFDADSQFDGCLRFTYGGCKVVLEGDGTITVTP